MIGYTSVFSTISAKGEQLFGLPIGLPGCSIPFKFGSLGTKYFHIELRQS